LSEQQHAILVLAREHRARYRATATVFVPFVEQEAQLVRDGVGHGERARRELGEALVARFENNVYCDLFRHEVLSRVYGLAITGPHAGSWRRAGAEPSPAYRDLSPLRDEDGVLSRVAVGASWFDGVLVTEKNYASLNVSASRALWRLIQRGLLAPSRWGYNLTAAGLVEEQAAA